MFVLRCGLLVAIVLYCGLCFMLFDDFSVACLGVNSVVHIRSGVLVIYLVVGCLCLFVCMLIVC